MKITKRQLRRVIQEAMELDLEVGDVILTGKFKNKRKVVKDFGKDDLGQPTINGMKALSFRIEKLMPKDKWSKQSKEALEFAKEVNEMKITKRQLRHLIVEIISSMDFRDDETYTQQFKKWAAEYMGTPSGANSSSVLATFLVDKGYDQNKNIVAGVAGDLGFDLRDVEMEVARQRKEYDAGGVLSDEEDYERGFKS